MFELVVESLVEKVSKLAHPVAHLARNAPNASRVGYAKFEQPLSRPL
jgi:hypothetical protein